MIRRTYAIWLFPVLVAALAIVFQGLGLVEALRYERADILNGQWWLFVTGNLVHLGWSHLALNLAGLAMVWWFYYDEFSLPQWLFVFFVSALFVTGGLFLLNPELIWYVGLSGLLHGLFVAGGIQLIGRDTRFAIILLMLFVAKLSYEQLFGSLPATTHMSGGPVVVDAHLYGAIGGAVSALMIRGRALLGAVLPKTDKRSQLNGTK
ncbi:MAG: rhombosortase [Thiotrichales bacterium]